MSAIQDKSIFKDSTLIVITLYRIPKVIKLSLENLFSVIKDRPNTYVILINNSHEKDIIDYYNSISHPQCFKFDLPFNFGKALACNFFFQDYINESNLPKTVISMDPDILFSKESFEYLVEASENLPQCGMIGMRYKNNNCNPELNLFFKPKKLVGLNKKNYFIKKPFMVTVAGPILAISGKKVFEDCKNRLFPKKYVKTYGGDDSAIYDVFRWKYQNGYLENTEATHLFSAGKFADEVES